MSWFHRCAFGVLVRISQASWKERSWKLSGVIRRGQIFAQASFTAFPAFHKSLRRPPPVECAFWHDCDATLDLKIFLIWGCVTVLYTPHPTPSCATYLTATSPRGTYRLNEFANLGGNYSDASINWSFDPLQLMVPVLKITFKMLMFELKFYYIRYSLHKHDAGIRPESPFTMRSSKYVQIIIIITIGQCTPVGVNHINFINYLPIESVENGGLSLMMQR